jgi:hypothetical protein
MTTILAIDPGCTETAWIVLRYGKPHFWGKEMNEVFRRRIVTAQFEEATFVLEKVESFGMAVGKEIFETVFWSGRFAEAWGRTFHRIGRKDVKLHLCGTTRAKDSNIRQAIIDKFGGSKEAAIGTKRKPGPLYGIKADVWAALAVGITYQETTP